MEHTEDIFLTLKKLAKKERSTKLRQRYDVVRLFLQGHHNKEIASIMNLSLPTIYSILACYSEKGLENLAPGCSTGRNKKLTQEQECAMYSTAWASAIPALRMYLQMLILKNGRSSGQRQKS